MEEFKSAFTLYVCVAKMELNFNVLCKIAVKDETWALALL